MFERLGLGDYIIDQRAGAVERHAIYPRTGITAHQSATKLLT
jgi:hypothetical protein